MLMLRKVITFLAVMTSLAHATVMTCPGSNRIDLGPSFWLSIGTCTASSSYGPTTGEPFPGTGTALQNANSVLCGLSTNRILRTFITPTVNGVPAGVIVNYDRTNSTVRIILPVGTQNFTTSGAAPTATFTGNAAVLTGAVAAPTVNLGDDAATPDGAVTYKGSALTTLGAKTGLTGVQAPALTMNSYTPAGTVAVGALPVQSGSIQNATGIEIPDGTDVHTLSVDFLAFCAIS